MRDMGHFVPSAPRGGRFVPTPASCVVELHPPVLAHVDGNYLAPQEKPFHQHPRKGRHEEEVEESRDNKAHNLGGTGITGSFRRQQRSSRRLSLWIWAGGTQPVHAAQSICMFVHCRQAPRDANKVRTRTGEWEVLAMLVAAKDQAEPWKHSPAHCTCTPCSCAFSPSLTQRSPAQLTRARRGVQGSRVQLQATALSYRPLWGKTHHQTQGSATPFIPNAGHRVIVQKGAALAAAPGLTASALFLLACSPGCSWPIH